MTRDRAVKRRRFPAGCVDWKALHGHAKHSMPVRYTSAHIRGSMRQANLVLSRRETCTVLRVADG